MRSLNRSLAVLIRKEQAYTGQLQKLTEELMNKVEFNYAIVNQPGDGFCLLNEEGEGVILAPLSECLSVIYMKGILSVKDHENLSI